MKKMILCLLSGLLLSPAALFAQWQGVPSPADRAFSFIRSNGQIFAGSENTGLWRSSDGGASFSLYPTGLSEMNFDIRDFYLRGDTLWAAIYGGGICRSLDGGTTWQPFNDGFETQPFAVGVRQLGDTVYAAIDYLIGLQPSGVYKSSIGQAAWQRSGSGFPTGLSGVTSFVITAAGVMAAGATLAGIRGNVQVSVDSGQTWLNRRIATVADVAALAIRGDDIYAGTSDGIYLSTDFGENWQRLSNQFPGGFVDDVQIAGNVLFAAIDGVGVVFSSDDGASWQVITGNLPIEDDFVSALFIDGSRLFAGLSAAHGVWSRALPAVGVSDPGTVPQQFSLQQNSPNPFNPATVIRFELPASSDVSLAVYNTAGQWVRTLAAGVLPAGKHEVVWDASDDGGRRVASGLYFYQLRAGDFTAVRKALVVK